MYKCGVCGKEFDQEFDRNVHQRRCRPKVEEKLPVCRKCGKLSLEGLCFDCEVEGLRQQNQQTYKLVLSKYKSGTIKHKESIDQITLVKNESRGLELGICFGLVVDWLQKITCGDEFSASYYFKLVWNNTSNAKIYQIVRDEVENKGKFYEPIVLTVNKIFDGKFKGKYQCVPLMEEYVSFIDAVDECKAGAFVQDLCVQLADKRRLSNGTLICSLDSMQTRHAIGISFEWRENTVLVYLFDPNSLFIWVAVPCDSKNELQLSLAVGLNIVLDQMIGGYVTNGSIHKYHSIAAILFSYEA